MLNWLCCLSCKLEICPPSSFCKLKQISEAVDIRARQGLLNALAGKMGKRMDALLVPLELLCCISRTEFPDKKAYIRWQKRQVTPPFSDLPFHII